MDTIVNYLTGYYGGFIAGICLVVFLREAYFKIQEFRD